MTVIHSPISRGRILQSFVTADSLLVLLYELVPTRYDVISSNS